MQICFGRYFLFWLLSAEYCMNLHCNQKINHSFIFIFKSVDCGCMSSSLFFWLVGCPSNCVKRQFFQLHWGLILSFDLWINLAALGWVLHIVESLFTGSIIHTQTFNLDRDAKTTMGKTNVKVEWCIDDKAAKEEREEKIDRILDYVLTARTIPRPICLLAKIRRSVTRPDWKWLFFQTLLKCVCVSPITWLLLIKLEPPLQCQWRISSFSFSSFWFCPPKSLRIK